MPNNDESVNVDEILSELGFGKFHCVNFVILFYIIFVYAANSSTFVFNTRETTYRCLIPECESNSSAYKQRWLSNAIPFQNDFPSMCEKFAIQNFTDEFHSEFSICGSWLFDNTSTESCDSWIYRDEDNIIKELDIPCQNWKRSLVGTVHYAGELVSLIFSGILADKYGRRKVVIALSVLSGVFGLIQSFSSNYWCYLICEFLNLSAAVGAYAAAYILIVEMLLPKHRIFGIVAIDLTFCLGTISLGLLAWATKSWKSLLRCTSIPAICSVIFFLLMSESFRWLKSKGKNKECTFVLKKAALQNNVHLSQSSILTLERMESVSSANAELIEINKTEENVLTLLKSPRLLMRILNCSVLYFTSVLALYGLSLDSVNISIEGNSSYINFIYVTLMDIPGVFFYLVLLKYRGRKCTLFSSLIAAGTFCVIYAVAPNINVTGSLILYLLGKMFSLVALSVTSVVTSEVFPTNIRNSSMNVCSIFGKIAGVLAPQVPLLKATNASLPMLVFGVLPIITSLAALTLPETKDKKLPDTIEEAVEMQ